MGLYSSSRKPTWMKSVLVKRNVSLHTPRATFCYCNMCVGCHIGELRIDPPQGRPLLCTYLLEERPSAPMRSELGFIVVVSIFLVIIA